MTISELIKHLETVIAEHGDLPVYKWIYYYDHELEPAKPEQFSDTRMVPSPDGMIKVLEI